MDCNSGGAGDGGARRWWLSLDGQPGRTVLWLLHRSVHPNTKVVAEIDGRRRTVCCARCAISEAYQEKKPLRLIAATDYVSGKDIDPKQAYFVEGSDRVLCAHNEARVDETKHVQRSEEHTSELQSHSDLVCRLLLEKKKKKNTKKRNSATIHT